MALGPTHWQPWCGGVQAAAECVNADDLLMDVLAGMFNDHKSCMGVMHDGALVGNISISDLRAFGPDMHAQLMQPVGRYLLSIKGLPVPQVPRHFRPALFHAIAQELRDSTSSVHPFPHARENPTHVRNNRLVSYPQLLGFHENTC